jgi:serine/threonine-protein kinase RsbW
MDQILFQKEIFIPSTIDGLNRCLDVIGELKEQFDLNFDTMFCLHTVLVEAVENAFIHGNKGVRELDVRVFFSISSNEIFVEVEDRGEGFDIDAIASPTDHLNLKRVGGRGIFFIKKLSSGCSTEGKGNIIRIKLNR